METVEKTATLLLKNNKNVNLLDEDDMRDVLKIKKLIWVPMVK